MPNYRLMSGGPAGHARIELTIENAVTQVVCGLSLVDAEEFIRLFDIHLDNVRALLGLQVEDDDE